MKAKTKPSVDKDRILKEATYGWVRPLWRLVETPQGTSSPSALLKVGRDPTQWSISH